MTHIMTAPATFPKSKRASRLIPQILPLAFILAVGVVTAYGFLKIESLVVQARAPLTSSDLKAQMDDLKWGLGLVITAAGLFAIAQASASWFSSQTFTKQAEETLKQISGIQEDVNRRFPIFSDYEQLRKEAYSDLERSLRSVSVSNKEEGYDWREDLYERMSLPIRQRLLSVERFIGVEFLQHPEDETAYTQSLQRLAHFYISKFKFERSQGFGYLGDLERADYYLNLAYDRSNNPFYLNDLGLLNLEWYATLYSTRADVYLQQAERLFKQSLSRTPKQQRANYNLGVLEKKRRDFEAALLYTKEAARHEAWEETAIEARTGDVFYNLACNYACLAVSKGDFDIRSNFVRNCIEALREPAEIGLVKKRVVDFDYDNVNGDLYPLLRRGDNEIVSRLTQIRPNLSKNRDTSPSTSPAGGKFSILAEAIKNLFR